jgi:CubicO group peptidase (beta-lactamase class C family)/D-alanyl-D-alanine dipeptidase
MPPIRFRQASSHVRTSLGRKGGWRSATTFLHLSGGVLLTTASLVVTSRASAQTNETAPRKEYAEVVDALRPFVQQQMQEKGLPALSIAIIDDQQIVWAQGFGMANTKTKIPASADTVYRIGSVSKLFTDIAIMQKVERGELNLDAPITEYLPEFRPRNPFNTPITLRQLMSHRSGLLREPPAGNYFETTQPTLAATVRSLNNTELVYAPNTHTKYSNAAIAVVGYVLEASSHQPFAEYLKTAVLDPMGLRHSSFRPDADIVASLAKAEMWTYDGLHFDAPTFQLGMAPAGSMYSTVKDLGRFASVLLARGKTENGTLLKPETLDQMWSPQFPNPGGRVFGLGFQVRALDGHRLVGHGGAIYGFATTLDLLPEDKVAVVVFATKDAANAVTERIGEETLRLVLAHREGKPLALPAPTRAVPVEVGRKLAGRYGRGDDAVELAYLGGHLSLRKISGGEQLELRTLGDDLIADGPVGYGLKVTPVADGVRIDSKTLARVAAAMPAPAPEKWRGLIGEYGWDHDILYVFEKDGRLNVLIEWMEFDALTQVGDDVFRFPTSGLYDGEKAVFTRDAAGNATQVQVSGVVFKRRNIGGVDGGVFRIPPVENFAQLRARALASEPPKENEEFRKANLVDVAALDPKIKLDIRYASTNNFLSTPVYSQARAFLQRPAAEALLRAHKKLMALGYGLLIHDAYRPWYVTKIFWDATPDDKKIFVADPSQGSRHNRGCAVDLSIYDLTTGKPIEMTGVYDEMSERSYPGYPGGTSLQRWHRELLRQVMENEGFLVYEFEWWHFDYGDWQKYSILNLTFEQLGDRKAAQYDNEPVSLWSSTATPSLARVSQPWALENASATQFIDNASDRFSRGIQ